MSNLTPFLHRNQEFAANDHQPDLSPIPTHQVFIVTCMDGRVDPADFLGVGRGDALVMRNAGGRVDDEVVAEIAFIAAATEMMQGEDAQPFEVAVIHHTGCGTGLLADDGFRSTYAARIDVDESTLADKAVIDPRRTVADDVAKLRASTKLPARVTTSGHVYDLDTGLVTTVVAP